jgi:hypothetical protein
MGQEILVLNAANESEIDRAFATAVERKADAIIYSANTLSLSRVESNGQQRPFKR